jgi:hypothetical protein
MLELEKQLLTLYNKRGCLCSMHEWCESCNSYSPLNQEIKKLEELLNLNSSHGYGKIKTMLENKIKEN